MTHGHLKNRMEAGQRMAKMFERADLTANDDGTFTISITPLRKRDKSESGEVCTNYPDSKTYTAASLEEAIGKVQSFAGMDSEKEIKEPEEGEDTDDMDTFMEPRMGEDEAEEEEK